MGADGAQARQARPDGLDWSDPRMARVKAAVDSLSAPVCVCGAGKERRRCFCNRCYWALPAEMRRDLWRQVTHGFEEAYEEAAAWLEKRRGKAVNGNLRASQDCLDLIVRHEAEGGKPRLKPYRCPSGRWTNGFGHTAGVTAETPAITLEQAWGNLRADVAGAERLVKLRVKVPLNQQQFDALTSFVFNLKQEKWNERDCTLLRLLNLRNYSGAAAEFPRWCFGTDPETGKPVKLGGLIARRADERALFLRPSEGQPA